jgi:hypothetical protein
MCNHQQRFAIIRCNLVSLCCDETFRRKTLQACKFTTQTEEKTARNWKLFWATEPRFDGVRDVTQNRCVNILSVALKQTLAGLNLLFLSPTRKNYRRDCIEWKDKDLKGKHWRSRWKRKCLNLDGDVITLRWFVGSVILLSCSAAIKAVSMSLCNWNHALSVTHINLERIGN